MSALLIAAYAAHWMLILAWSLCHFQINDARRRACRPRPHDPARPAASSPRVTVVLPACNEQVNLEDCANAVLAQAGVELRLVIVDDRSGDHTPRIARKIAAADERCRVMRIESLPSGWMGKSHACFRGADAGTGDWLLFVDADVRLEPAAVASAIGYADEHALQVFSLWPADGSVGFWERLLIPLCGAMIVIWYGGVAQRSSARGGAFANGQFLLVRRSAYETVGGHESVRAALIEDIPLARTLARAGFSVGSALGAELAHVRMYRGLGETFRGWRRIYVGVLRSMQILGCVASLLLGSALPYVLLCAAGVSMARSGPGAWNMLWLASAATHLAVLMSVSVRFFSLARCRLRYLWLYPLSVAGVLAILAAALWARLFGRGVSWRGTAYRVDCAAAVASIRS